MVLKALVSVIFSERKIKDLNIFFDPFRIKAFGNHNHPLLDIDEPDLSCLLPVLSLSPVSLEVCPLTKLGKIQSPMLGSHRSPRTLCNHANAMLWQDFKCFG